MNKPTTAREALIAELLGDADRLFTKAQEIAPLIDEATKKLQRTADQFNNIAVQNADIFLDKSGKALSAFIQKTDALKSTVDALKLEPATLAIPVAAAQEPKQSSNHVQAKLWYLLPCVFTTGAAFGAIVAFFILK